MSKNLLDSNEWNLFENDMIAFMRRGIRHQILAWPAIIYVIGLMLFLTPLLLSSLPELLTWSILCASMWIAICFSGFRIFSGYLLEHQYDRCIFHGARLSELKKGQQEWKPSILINSTSLEYGGPMVFTTMRAVEEFSLLPDLMPGEHQRDRVYCAAGSSKFASAVAASSAFPPVFGPVQVRSLLDERIEIASKSTDELQQIRKRLYEYARSKLPVRLYAIDGGVYDNQGINRLVMGECDAWIVSDAAVPFRTLVPLSMTPPEQEVLERRIRWLPHWRTAPLFPEGHLFRRFTTAFRASMRILRFNSILFERLRELTYLNIGQTTYISVELAEKRDFMATFGVQLARDVRIKAATYWLKVAASRIRTDLDSFSPLEISTLMYLGYREVDTALRRSYSRWVEGNAPAKFATATQSTNICWEQLDEQQLMRYADYLGASASRAAFVRLIRRCVSSLRRGPAVPPPLI